jgi:DNA-binding MarR family transcriptional regulator
MPSPRSAGTPPVRARSLVRRSRSSIEAALIDQRGKCICGNLRMASRLVTAYFDEALRPCGIEANQMTMLWVAHIGDGQPAKNLARETGMDQSTVSRNLAVLESLKLIRTIPAPDDRRQRLVTLTRLGRSTLFRALPHWERAQADLAAMAGEVADLVSVGRVLRRVARHMQAA